MLKDYVSEATSYATAGAANHYKCSLWSGSISLNFTLVVLYSTSSLRGLKRRRIGKVCLTSPLCLAFYKKYNFISTVLDVYE